MTRTKKASYGQCPVCVSPILFPGLDGFKCSECGWLKTSEITIAIKKRTARVRSTKQDSTSAVVTHLSSSADECSSGGYPHAHLVQEVENPEIITCNSS
jgi:hypothetical protein